MAGINSPLQQVRDPEKPPKNITKRWLVFWFPKIGPGGCLYLQGGCACPAPKNNAQKCPFLGGKNTRNVQKSAKKIKPHFPPLHFGGCSYIWNAFRSLHCRFNESSYVESVNPGQARISQRGAHIWGFIFFEYYNTHS